MNINTSYSLHLSFMEARLTSGSWGECRAQICFMSHLESTCLQLFLAIESQKGTLHMECLFLHTSHVSFMRKHSYNQQLTVLRHCDTGNHFRVFSLTSLHYFMTFACAHSFVRLAKSLADSHVVVRCGLHLRVLLRTYNAPGCALTA